MLDIGFDIEKREIMMLPDGSDFDLTDNPSAQNGGILLYARCPNLTNPIAGIGVEEFINGNQTTATFQLNRWKSQAYSDGATLAKWTATHIASGIEFKTEQSYI